MKGFKEVFCTFYKILIFFVYSWILRRNHINVQELKLETIGRNGKNELDILCNFGSL